MLRNDKGVAIIIALLTILILSTLGAAIIFSTQQETTTTYNFKKLTQARYAAEAGAQATMNWLIYSYPALAPTDFTTYPNGVLAVSYGAATNPVQCVYPASPSNSCASNGPIVLSALANIPANYPDNAVQNSFCMALASSCSGGVPTTNQSISVDCDSGGSRCTTITYATTATLQAMSKVNELGSTKPAFLQRWQILSQATICPTSTPCSQSTGSLPQVQVTATIERMAAPIFTYGVSAQVNTTVPVNACGAITLTGAGSADSFDSTTGPYPAGQMTSSGTFGTNGSIHNSFSGTVGTIYYLSPSQCSSDPAPASTSVALTAPIAFNSPPGPTATPGPGAQALSPAVDCTGIPAGCTGSSGTYTLAPGGYHDLAISGSTVHFQQGIYNINSLTIDSASQIVIDTGPAIVNIVGDNTNATLPMSAMQTIAVSLGGPVATTTGNPKDFQILYQGNYELDLLGGPSTQGGSSSYGIVYAPLALVKLSAGSAAHWYGAIVGNAVSDSNVSIHFDRSLVNGMQYVGFSHLTGFSWSKY